MSDIVVTVPQSRWREWIAEGDLPGEAESGDEYAFTVGRFPSISPGERVYIVAHGKLRGYAPLVRKRLVAGRYELIRRGGAVALTIDEPVRGFPGFRYCWWDRAAERPFPDWKTP